jgi:hypothetical protein
MTALVVLVVVILFVAWLAAPITWRDGEGDLIDDGEKFAQQINRWRLW